ncbi:SdpI family protein [Flavobacterium sp.]|uniref:SdpI family protein n=1 Tax=Flavobacterium sp. TaxID=239 RepID=UPI003753B09B
MNNNLKKELPLLAIIALPIFYLFYVWKKLPEKIPTHFNIDGKIDSWGEKSSLILIVLLLPILTYGLLLIIPKIDPKKRIDLMGRKYHQLKFILVSFMSILALFIIYISKEQTLSNLNMILVLLGILFFALGNYFKVIQQNYFIGIKTPWTLESKEVWKLTHILAGKLWTIGGILVIFFSLILPATLNRYFFFTITGIITIVPIVYSYIKFKELKANN